MKAEFKLVEGVGYLLEIKAENHTEGIALQSHFAEGDMKEKILLVSNPL